MKRVVSIILLISISISLFSQSWKRNRIEAFIGIPTTQYFGDIGGTADASNALGIKDISFKHIRPGIVLGATYQYSDNICINAKLTSALWAQSDAGSRNALRGNAFTTFGNEISFNCMYYIISENHQGIFHNVTQLRGGMNSRMQNPFSLYIFGGLGANIFFVTAKDNLLNDTRFDGSQKATLLVPLGVGVKYKVSAQFALGFELGGRFLFTDNFDGLTTQFSEANDVYYIASITAHYRFLRNNTFKQRRRFKF